jgi:hypothetical protein
MLGRLSILLLFILPADGATGGIASANAWQVATTGSLCAGPLSATDEPGGDAPGEVGVEIDLATDRPDQSDIRSLAVQVVGELPSQDPPLVITARLITLAAGKLTDQYEAGGPLLYFVVTGSLQVSLDGTVSKRYSGGESVIVQTG